MITVLNQLDAGVSAQIEAAVPGVTAITLAPSGTMPPGITGDVLLIPRRSKNWAELLESGVSWVHIAGAGAEGIPTELLGDVTVSCSRGAYAVPMAEYVMAALLTAEKSIPNVWVSDQPTGAWGDLGRLEERAEELNAVRPWEAVPEQWGFAPVGTLVGRTVAIVGFGATGQRDSQTTYPLRRQRHRSPSLGSPERGAWGVDHEPRLGTRRC